MQQDPSQPTQYPYPSPPPQNWQTAPTPPPPPTQNWQTTPPPPIQYPPTQYPYSAPPPQNWQPMPPQPKKNQPWLWIVGIVLVLLIAGSAAVAAVANHNQGNQVNTSPTATAQTNQNQSIPGAQPTSAPTSAPATAHKVGDQVALDGWTVTVNGVTTSSGDDFDQPKAGNTFLLIDVTVVNGTGQAQTFSSLLSFTLKDSTGQKYDQTIVTSAPSTPDGNITNGGKLRGTIAYEIPTSIQTVELDFTPDITSTDVAIWNLTV